MKIIGTATRSLPLALGLSRALLARAEAEGVAWMAASVIQGPAVVLGAAQRAGRVLDLEACASAGVPVWRRATSGAAVHVAEHAIVWALALPHVASLAADATARTLINRNVRGFLEGIRRAGAAAHYFGRDHVSVQKRPAALIGFEESERGAVLLEVLAGFEASFALPTALIGEEERALDRYAGKAPLGLGEVMKKPVEVVAREVMNAVAERDSMPASEARDPDAEVMSEVTGADDPLPSGFTVGPRRRVPIGWIDTGFDPRSGRAWLGGDVLAPAHVLRAVAAGEALSREAPIEGATLADLVEAARALGATSPAR